MFKWKIQIQIWKIQRGDKKNYRIMSAYLHQLFDDVSSKNVIEDCLQKLIGYNAEL